MTDENFDIENGYYTNSLPFNIWIQETQIKSPKVDGEREYMKKTWEIIYRDYGFPNSFHLSIGEIKSGSYYSDEDKAKKALKNELKKGILKKANKEKCLQLIKDREAFCNRLTKMNEDFNKKQSLKKFNPDKDKILASWIALLIVTIGVSLQILAWCGLSSEEILKATLLILVLQNVTWALVYSKKFREIINKK